MFSGFRKTEFSKFDFLEAQMIYLFLILKNSLISVSKSYLKSSAWSVTKILFNFLIIIFIGIIVVKIWWYISIFNILDFLIFLFQII